MSVIPVLRRDSCALWTRRGIFLWMSHSLTLLFWSRESCLWSSGGEWKDWWMEAWSCGGGSIEDLVLVMKLFNRKNSLRGAARASYKTKRMRPFTEAHINCLLRKILFPFLLNPHPPFKTCPFRNPRCVRPLNRYEILPKVKVVSKRDVQDFTLSSFVFGKLVTFSANTVSMLRVTSLARATDLFYSG